MSAPDFEALQEKAAGLGLDLFRFGPPSGEWFEVADHARLETASFDRITQVATYLRGVRSVRLDDQTCLACPTCGALWPTRDVPERMRETLNERDSDHG